MAFDQNIRKRDGIADGNIGTNLILKLGTAGRDHVVQAGANDIPIAVSPSGTHDRDSGVFAAELDDQFEVYYGGLVKIKCGATVLVGEYLKSDVNGKAVPVLTVVSSGPQNHIGIALNAGLTDEIITVQVEIGVRSFIT